VIFVGIITKKHTHALSLTSDTVLASEPTSNLADFVNPHGCCPQPDDVFNDGRRSRTEQNHRKIAVKRQKYYVGYLDASSKTTIAN